MKTSALIFGALIMAAGGYAMAYPEVGDEAKWAGTYKKGADPEKPVELMMKVIKHDMEDKEWDVQMDWTMDGKTTSKVKDIDEDKMWSPAMWMKVKTNCVAKGGKLEDVTVPAGTFATCHKTKTKGTRTVEIWWADAPFGIVKVNKMNTDAAKMKEVKMEMQSFTAAPTPPTPPTPPEPPTEPEPDFVF